MSATRSDRAREVVEAARAAHSRGRVPTPPGLGPRGQRARVQLLEAAQRVFVAKGFEATTIRDIAAEAGVSRANFYQYFADRFDVMACLVGGAVIRALEDRHRWNADEGRDGLRCFLARSVATYASTADFQRMWEEVTQSDEELAALRRGLADVYAGEVADELRRAGAAGRVRSDLDARELARVLCGMTDRYCYDVFIAGAPGGRDVGVDDVVELLTVAWAELVHLQ